MRRLSGSAAIMAASLLVFMAPGASVKGPPENPNGWGTVVSDSAKSQGGLGEHASSFAGQPRQGVGNVARDPALNDLDNGHPGGHGCFVGGVDGDPATDCNGSPGNAR
jgi:hypothetical protein